MYLIIKLQSIYLIVIIVLCSLSLLKTVLIRIYATKFSRTCNINTQSLNSRRMKASLSKWSISPISSFHTGSRSAWLARQPFITLEQ